MSDIQNAKEQIIFLVGPTASGKSEIAVLVAEKIPAEIVSCDSMCVYREMDIGTSKPSIELQRRVPHHLIDILMPDEEFNVAMFKKKAEILIKEIHTRGKTPLFVGGSGLYMKVLLDGIFEEEKKSNNLPEEIKEGIREKDTNYLYQELKKVDPEAANVIHPKDRRRVIRALKVYYNLGMPISKLKKGTRGISDKYEVRIFGLRRNRESLYERINRRVDEMFDKGLVDEVKRINKRYNLSKTAKEALGYKEILKYLDGQISLDEAKRRIKVNTRHFAKRQMTWFKKDSRIEWIEIEDNEGPESVADRICRMIKYGV